MSLAQLGTLLWAERRRTRHAIASVRHESKLKVIFVSTFAVLLWIGIFAASRFGFRLFTEFGAELLGPGGERLVDLVMARLLSVFALALFVLLTFSNILVAFQTLYRAREVPLLLLSPLSIPTFFLGRFVECVVVSSWASAYLGSPILLAYGLVSDAPPTFYLALLAFFVPFVTLPAALGATITLGLVRFFPRRHRRRYVVAGLVAVVVLYGVYRPRVALPDVGEPGSVEAVVDVLQTTSSAFLPSQWLAAGVLSAAGGEGGGAMFYFLLLLANALFAVWLASLAAEAWFFPGWAALHDEGEGPRRGDRGSLLERIERLLPGLSPPTRALVVKDLALFWRDPAQWTQFVVFFGILALYVANMDTAAPGQGLGQAWGTLLNLLAGLLILASLTTRFVFPLISLEGPRFWILGLAPLPRRSLVRQKFWSSVLTTVLFPLGVTLLSAFRLELAPLAVALSLLAVGAAALALSGLAVGLGCLYPNFAEDNPARVVSGLGGTLNFLLSLLYVALVGLALAAVLLWSRLEPQLGAAASPWVVTAAVAWIVLLSTLTCLLPLRLGLRHLESLEI